DRCQFGQSTILLDGNHRFRDLTRPMLQQGYDYRPLRIEDDATVTTKCTIMADIGTRAFIGANSVVSKPIPPYTVAVGAPPLGIGPAAAQLLERLHQERDALARLVGVGGAEDRGGGVALAARCEDVEADAGLDRARRDARVPRERLRGSVAVGGHDIASMR